jgi:hypothetical protein
MALYNMPFLYRLYPNYTLSATQLRQALQQVVVKYQSLRTSFIFDKENNILTQRIIDPTDYNNQLFRFVESVFETDDQLNNIMYDEKRSCQHFDLAQGLVFRCHLVYYNRISSDGLLCDKDILIFNCHYALFDFQSMNVFLDDLNQVYTTGQLSPNDDTSLRYLDCEYQYFYFKFE